MKDLLKDVIRTLISTINRLEKENKEQKEEIFKLNSSVSELKRGYENQRKFIEELQREHKEFIELVGEPVYVDTDSIIVTKPAD